MSERPFVSLCTIAKDEAENLPRCLASARGVVDEMVVVDTGSRDDTPAIALREGARVFHVGWEKDFAKAKNACISRARGDWIVFLDADEELCPAWASELRPRLAVTQSAALRIVIENLLPDGDVARSSDAPAVRVFRNLPVHRYEGKIHEQIAPSILRAKGQIQDVDLRIIHHGYRRPTAQGASRIDRNLALLRDALERTPRDAWLHFHLALTIKAKGDLPGARRAMRDALALDRRTLDASARVRAYTVLAQVELAEGRNDAAIEHGMRALALDVDDVTAAHVVAVAMSSRGDLQGALRFFATVRRSPRCDATLARDIDRIFAYAHAMPRS